MFLETWLIWGQEQRECKVHLGYLVTQNHPEVTAQGQDAVLTLAKGQRQTHGHNQAQKNE